MSIHLSIECDSHTGMSASKASKGLLYALIYNRFCMRTAVPCDVAFALRIQQIKPFPKSFYCLFVDCKCVGMLARFFILFFILCEYVYACVYVYMDVYTCIHE